MQPVPLPRLAVRMTNEVTDRLGCDDEPSAASQAVPRDRADASWG
ncbi:MULTISPECIES: hypothetical protein [unclassified Streptomyces]|nr:hypothetical protein [Streptomyces sp. CB01580]